jgi:hypothetical protein
MKYLFLFPKQKNKDFQKTLFFFVLETFFPRNKKTQKHEFPIFLAGNVKICSKLQKH